MTQNTLDAYPINNNESLRLSPDIKEVTDEELEDFATLLMDMLYPQEEYIEPTDKILANLGEPCPVTGKYLLTEI